MEDDLTKSLYHYFSGKLDENAHICTEFFGIKYKMTNFYLIIKIKDAETVLVKVK